MNFLKIAPKPSCIPDQPNTRRRSFMWKISAAIPALLASAVSGKSDSGANMDAGLVDQVDHLSRQLENLEDENAIRRLHRSYEDLLTKGKYEEVVNLFTDDGEVAFNGGIFKGKFQGVRRLYCERFQSGLAGRVIEPAPGFQTDSGKQQDIIKIAADRRSATGKFSFSIQIGTPMPSDSQLVKMARLHGEGIMKWWEGGTYEVFYVKSTGNSAWKIKRLEYRVLSKADYRPGKFSAKPISVPLFSKLYPEDPAGPDILMNMNQRGRPCHMVVPS